MGRYMDMQRVKVGRRHIVFYDLSRSNWSGNGPRPVNTTIWYPAPAQSVEVKWKSELFYFGVNALDAPMEITKKTPLILLSHGTGGSMAQLSWLAEGLVREGFIVAGVNHHGNTATEALDINAFVLTAERAKDLSFLLSTLLEHEDFFSVIDDQHIGVAGFSLGGYTAVSLAGGQLTLDKWRMRCKKDIANPMCHLPPEAKGLTASYEVFEQKTEFLSNAYKRDSQSTCDSRIRAVYAIAPALVSIMSKDELACVKVPTRVVLAKNDKQVLHFITKEKLESSVPQVDILTIPDTGHYTFLAKGTLKGKILARRLCMDSLRVRRSRMHSHIVNDACLFFKEKLL